MDSSTISNESATRAAVLCPAATARRRNAHRVRQSGGNPLPDHPQHHSTVITIHADSYRLQKKCAVPAHFPDLAKEATLMDAGRTQRDIGITPETSERAHRQGCLCGLTRAATEWIGALTRARTAAAGEPSSDQLLEGWAAEAGQGEHEDRQEAVRRMRALQEATANTGVPQSLEISVLSLTSLPAALPTGLCLRGLHVGYNRLDTIGWTVCPITFRRRFESSTPTATG